MKYIKMGICTMILGVSCVSHAEVFKDSHGNSLEISGFFKVEMGFNDRNLKVIGPDFSQYKLDARSAFTTAPLNPYLASSRSNLNLQQVTVAVAHEFDNAVSTEVRLTKRWRQGVHVNSEGYPVNENILSPWFTRQDVVGQDYYEKLIGISRPDLGSFRYGTQLSRSWSRSDAFSYPVGLAYQWAGSGSGFGIFPEAYRFTSPLFEDANGKLTAELTYATNRRNSDNVFINIGGPGPTKPVLFELFLQYSNEKNLVELVFQTSRGAGQSSWGQSGLVGWIGDPDSIVGQTGVPRSSNTPSQSVLIVQGNYFMNAENRLTYGLRRNQWSGSAPACNWNPTPQQCYFGIEAGFNYGDATTNYQGYAATSYDAMLGWSWYRGLYTYTIGGVYFGKASSDNPIEWGQSNQAVSVNLGLYRAVPEIYKNLNVYGGLSFTHFDKIGPPPLSMPSVGSYNNINSLYDKNGAGLILGLNLTF